MSQLLPFDPDHVATKDDLASTTAVLKADIAEVKAELKADITEVKAELKADIAGIRAGLLAVNQRLDRLFLTLIAGSFGIVISLIGLIITTR